MITSKAILEVNNLTKRYRAKTTVNGISFSVNPGEILGLLGPNGAGKTTIFRMISNLCPKNSGEITVNGYSIDTSPRQAILSMGITIDTPSFYEHLSAMENLKYSASMYPKANIKELPELIDIVGLSGRENDKVKTYSMGMRQRLGLARALIASPKLIMLDEPANGLDPQGMVELYNLIRELAAEKHVGFIVSSHLLHDMENLCTHVLILNHGSCLTQGPVAEITKEETQIIEVSGNDTDLIKTTLGSVGGVKVIRTHNGIVIAEIDCELNKVLGAVVASGVCITNFSVRKNSLEDVFLRLTGGAKR